jgi:hypothetical protein
MIRVSLRGPARYDIERLILGQFASLVFLTAAHFTSRKGAFQNAVFDFIMREAGDSSAHVQRMSFDPNGARNLVNRSRSGHQLFSVRLRHKDVASQRRFIIPKIHADAASTFAFALSLPFHFMTAQIINGTLLSQQLRADVSRRAAALAADGVSLSYWSAAARLPRFTYATR